MTKVSERTAPKREVLVVGPYGVLGTGVLDAAAAGSMFGDGVGVVALKRLAEALEDGDIVLAVIRGSAINNDGATKVSYAAPSVLGQAEVVTHALEQAGVEPRASPRSR